MAHVANRGLLAAPRLLEGVEFALEHQQRGGSVHRLEVEILVDARTAALEEGILAGVDPVRVGPLGRAEPRVVLLAHLEDAPHPDVRGQHSIELPAGLLPVVKAGTELPLPLEMRVECRGVDTRIRAATADDGGVGPEKAGQLLLEHLLHGNGFRLALPAMVRGAVVAQVKEATDGHGRRIKPSR